MKLLFVCSRNQWRSRTAEDLFKNRSGIEVRSAGTEPSARIRVTAKLIDWADLILVMEKRHWQRLSERFPNETADKNFDILDIPDEYGYMDPELVEMLEVAVGPYLIG
ncbi:MAG: protein tyrosine phosphatase [Cytophagales bacterium]|nr:MAG: protein tyrosine phosphatase [Cytophagales bacterium]